MHARRLFLRLTFAASVALASCSMDGGSSGTGVTTAQGNVASAQSALRRPTERSNWLARLGDLLRLEGSAVARSAVEGVRVSIEGTDFAATSDSNGFFAVQGDFAGPVGMRLEREDGLSARLVIVVPNGGLLTLSNVRIDGNTATVDGQRVQFDGVVDSTDCGRGIVQMVSRRRPQDGHRYTVHVERSAVRDANGNPIACGDLRGGQAVRVDGDVREDGGFEADDVEVDDDDRSGPGGENDGDNSGPGGGDDDSSGGGPGDDGDQGED
jgi:hypothetical protein